MALSPKLRKKIITENHSFNVLEKAGFKPMGSVNGPTILNKKNGSREYVKSYSSVINSNKTSKPKRTFAEKKAYYMGLGYGLNDHATQNDTIRDKFYDIRTSLPIKESNSFERGISVGHGSGNYEFEKLYGKHPIRLKKDR